MSDLHRKYEILSSAKIGIEFEFFSELTIASVAKEMTKALGKKVIVPVVIKDFGKEDKGGYHSDVEPTANMFKIERDFSGGNDMYEMITGPLVYEEARLIIIKALKWIKEKGWTDSKASIHLNVSFDDYKSKLKIPLMNINILKLILSFDEEFIYSRFPDRRDSVYAKSIYNVYPVNRFVFFETPNCIDKNDYILPNEKYYGINFTKLPKNYLEFRYVGGEGYENKTTKILEILDYIIYKLYSTLQTGDSYTPEEKNKLFNLLSYQKKVVRTFSEPEKFAITYPDISLTVDMKGDFQIIKSYWVTIRDKLFSLIADSGLRAGHFNLDTDVSVFQLMNGKMMKANHVTDMEIIDCEISGTFSNCDFYRCKIISSRLTKCKLMESNDVHDSKVEFTIVKNSNTLVNCYINNPTELIDGKIQGGVIRNGIIGKNAEISRETLIVESTGQSTKDKEDNSGIPFGTSQPKEK